MKLSELRSRHPRLTYQSFGHKKDGNDLLVEFVFELAGGVTFKPQLRWLGLGHQLEKLESQAGQKLLFHLGLIELISYWKAACPPEIVIEARELDTAQLEWWHQLLVRGLGEFWFVNQIDAFREAGFVTWRSGQNEFTSQAFNDYGKADWAADSNSLEAPLTHPHNGADWRELAMSRLGIFELAKTDQSILVPVGGGKDSALVLCLLEKKVAAGELEAHQVVILLVNPTPAARQVATQFPFKIIEVARQIDPKLIELNQSGYLNGHTPFSAYLAFLSLVTAELIAADQVVLANERSANQENLTWAGLKINHQYSKSAHFEQSMRHHQSQFLPQSAHYFSLLRFLSELQIAGLLKEELTAKPELLGAIVSCNRGGRTGTWCKECPKCLFAYLMLAPFLSGEQLMIMFDENLLNKESLLGEYQALLGHSDHKPLECVGLYEESLLASWRLLEMAGDDRPLPRLLDWFKTSILPREANLAERYQNLLKSWE